MEGTTSATLFSWQDIWNHLKLKWSLLNQEFQLLLETCEVAGPKASVIHQGCVAESDESRENDWSRLGAAVARWIQVDELEFRSCCGALTVSMLINFVNVRGVGWVCLHFQCIFMSPSPASFLSSGYCVRPRHVDECFRTRSSLDVRRHQGSSGFSLLKPRTK